MGFAPRQHSNAHRLPHNPLPYECKEHVVKFLQNFAEANAILLPVHIPGYKRDDVQLLPSSMMKVFLLRLVNAHTCLTQILSHKRLSGCSTSCPAMKLVSRMPHTPPSHLFLAAVCNTDKGHKAHEQPLLGLSEKQCGDNEGSKQAGYSLIGGKLHHS